MDTQPSRDVVARLGHLALGTRFKRLGEQLQAGVAEAIGSLGGTLQPAQLVLLAELRERDGLTVAELVDALGISQPAVSRSLGALQKAGIVTLTTDSEDGRVRRVSLTNQGRHALRDIHDRLFPRVAAAAEQLCEGLDLLDRLAAVEGRLRDRSFARRIEEAKA